MFRRKDKVKLSKAVKYFVKSFEKKYGISNVLDYMTPREIERYLVLMQLDRIYDLEPRTRLELLIEGYRISEYTEKMREELDIFESKIQEIVSEVGEKA